MLQECNKSFADTQSSLAATYKQAAEQGDADAQFAIGCMYGLGQGVEVNTTEAMKWLHMSAKQGNEDAKKVLTHTFTGLHKQAEQGDAEAQFALGCVYSLGQGVDANTTEAIKWLLVSAKQGNEDAKKVLADFHNRIQPIEQNKT